MLSSLILFLASWFAEFDTKLDMHAHAGYLKPGAAVQISHDYKGNTALNSYETISIDVTHIYQNGVLAMTVLPSPGLDILSPLDTLSVHIMPDVSAKTMVQFSGRTEGRFLLALEIIHQDLTGQQSRRVLSIPVQIGEGQTDKETDKGTQIIAQSQTVNSGLIGLKAKETIY